MHTLRHPRGYRSVFFRYSSKTRWLLSFGTLVLFGETKTGIVIPRPESCAASSAVSAMLIVITATVDPAATGALHPSISTIESAGSTQLSMTTSATSASRFPLEWVALLSARFATDVTATTLSLIHI